MTKEILRKHLDLSVLAFDTADGLPYEPKRAIDPDIIKLRKSWPKDTVVLAQQHPGTILAGEIVSHDFKDDIARTQAFGPIAMALVTSAWHTYAQKSPRIMRSVIDLPELAYDPVSIGDNSEWRETKAGSLSRIKSQLAFTANKAYELFTLHQHGSYGRRYEATQRQFSRSATSTAIRMATIGLLSEEPDTRTATQIQNDVWTLGLDFLDQTRFAHESYGNHITLAQLADDPRDTWLNSSTSPETRATFDSAFETYE